MWSLSALTLYIISVLFIVDILLRIHSRRRLVFFNGRRNQSTDTLHLKVNKGTAVWDWIKSIKKLPRLKQSSRRTLFEGGCVSTYFLSFFLSVLVVVSMEKDTIYVQIFVATEQKFHVKNVAL